MTSEGFLVEFYNNNDEVYGDDNTSSELLTNKEAPIESTSSLDHPTDEVVNINIPVGNRKTTAASVANQMSSPTTPSRFVLHSNLQQNNYGVWPQEALRSSFRCIQLIVEEFLESSIFGIASVRKDGEPLLTTSHGNKEVMDPHVAVTDVQKARDEIVTNILEALSLFAAQNRDVNVSLTGLELLWKVTDLAITTFSTHDQDNDNLKLSGRSAPPEKELDFSTISESTHHFIECVLDVSLRRLLLLSMDSRPEIRHSAMNT